MLGVLDVAEVVARLEEVLLPAEGLGDDRPDSPQPGGGYKVVVLEFLGVCAAVEGDGGCLAGGIDCSDASLKDADVGCLQGWYILVLHPELLGVAL